MDPSSEAAETIVSREKEREALIEESVTDPEYGLNPTLKNVIAGTIGGKTGSHNFSANATRSGWCDCGASI